MCTYAELLVRLDRAFSDVCRGPPLLSPQLLEPPRRSLHHPHAAYQPLPRVSGCGGAAAGAANQPLGIFFLSFFFKGSSPGPPRLDRWRQEAVKPLKIVNPTSPSWTPFQYCLL